jgi:hypothetical protein
VWPVLRAYICFNPTLFLLINDITFSTFEVLKSNELVI